MRRLFHKVKSKIADEDGRSSSPEQPESPVRGPPSTKMQPPTALEVLRYRYQYGVNLGGIFVLEKWLWPGMFESWAKGDSELDAVSA